jgi:hypothetical protein
LREGGGGRPRQQNRSQGWILEGHDLLPDILSLLPRGYVRPGRLASANGAGLVGSACGV